MISKNIPTMTVLHSTISNTSAKSFVNYIYRGTEKLQNFMKKQKRRVI